MHPLSAPVLAVQNIPDQRLEEGLGAGKTCLSHLLADEARLTSETEGTPCSSILSRPLRKVPHLPPSVFKIP